MVRCNLAGPGRARHHVRYWMALVGMATTVLAGCGPGMTPEETKAMSHLQSLGATVTFRDGGYAVDLSQMKIKDEDLIELRNIPKLKSLSLVDTPITDMGLEHLVPIQSLVLVDLTRAKVSREGIARLRQAMPNTEILY